LGTGEGAANPFKGDLKDKSVGQLEKKSKRGTWGLFKKRGLKKSWRS